ncbi:Hsp20/alpha crystallin family protein [Accumulibacter sp.]|jgi:HSP20 family protein|uniref:SHSP domain-containing protein n=1 Tax=Accumulibacter regalis TaxID=522306 RepID=C7RRK4_ACCRE|nr:Hsp20/alpha crystallin family protein [Accumulibacter sp.]MBN8452709.1 Hsp20/alpha crystallin family protein [Accumulibacter sp.]MBN8499508.1 Hsp20/alpha crystallin family protein [Accumulibacter sp.]MBO3714472.1 Hsp20/alpha crystallin family protein [Accumulibacter sp.]
MRSHDQSLWVWAEALDLLRAGEQLQRRFFTLAGLQSVTCWVPAVDVYDEGDELKVVVALPGVDSGHLEVLVDDEGLAVRGERPMPSTSQHAAIHRLEIPYGRFERRIELPGRDFHVHEQFLENGCLVVVLRQP